MEIRTLHWQKGKIRYRLLLTVNNYTRSKIHKSSTSYTTLENLCHSKEPSKVTLQWKPRPNLIFSCYSNIWKSSMSERMVSHQSTSQVRKTPYHKNSSRINQLIANFPLSSKSIAKNIKVLKRRRRHIYQASTQLKWEFALKNRLINQ